MFPFIVKTNSLSLFPVGRAPIMIEGSHPNFAAVRTALVAGNYDEAIELSSVKFYVAKASGGRVTLRDDGIFYDDQPITHYLGGKIMEMFSGGLPVEPYCHFLSNLFDNPSRISIQELYLFLEAANLPITSDGCFIAYKAVRHDFKDIHSGQFDNSPGAVHFMPRNQVDDVRERTCSYGFHAAAYEYARNFMGSGRMVAVKINPADVVSVPSDYNNQKLRTCRYEVLYEIPDAVDVFKGQLIADTLPSVEQTFYEHASDSEAEFSAWIAVNDTDYNDGYDEGYDAGYDNGWHDALKN
jgi:hypothetical protein